MDYEIQRCTRRCVATDRELRPGETYYTVLMSEGAVWVRRDYSAEAWQGAPAGAVGWWKSRVPDPQSRKIGWAPGEVMAGYFHELSTRDAEADTWYVLTLLMIRRRLLRLEETERDAEGREVLLVYCPGSETEYRVPCVDLAPARIAEIQEALAQLLIAPAD